MKLFSEHQLLLMRRESRIVMGRHAISLWLLALVLTVTFLSIAFSEGSMAYLDEKMNDPFTNWVNINLYEAKDNTTTRKLKDYLNDASIQEHFSFDGWQTVNRSTMNMVSLNGSHDSYSALSYERLSSDLIAKVLSEENVIKDYCICSDSIHESSMGIIATRATIEKLGYDIDHVPPFLDYHSHSVGADTLGVKLMDDNYARAPLPLLAVVKHLPMNVEVVNSKYLYKQISDNIDFPLSLSHEKYVRELRFFVPENVVDFTLEQVQSMLPDSLRTLIFSVTRSESSLQQRLRNWQKGCMMMVYLTESPQPSLTTVRNIEDILTGHYAKEGVVRTYDYLPGNIDGWKTTMGVTVRDDMDDFLSVHFTRLDSIRAFGRFVKNKTEIQIEMIQLESKENFSAVSNMAGILTLALIAFSITSIVFFIVNMMQNYFQKVKRNLGTFKAFGISTSELMRVYIAIIMGIVLVALAVALLVTYAVELLLPIMGIVKEGRFCYLQLWNVKTFGAVVIIIAATISSVLIVMRRLLRQTPGNLIYDR